MGVPTRVAAILALVIAPAAGFSPLGSSVSLRHSHAAPAVSAGHRVPLALAPQRNAPRGGLLGMRASSNKVSKSAKALAAPAHTCLHPLPAGISPVSGSPRWWCLTFRLWLACQELEEEKAALAAMMGGGELKLEAPSMSEKSEKVPPASLRISCI